MTDFMPMILAMCPLVGALCRRERLIGRVVGPSKSFSFSISSAEVGEVKINL